MEWGFFFNKKEIKGKRDLGWELIRLKLVMFMFSFLNLVIFLVICFKLIRRILKLGKLYCIINFYFFKFI